ncbi:MAG: FMN-binding protein [Oscillospiraceae bacterium]
MNKKWMILLLMGSAIVLTGCGEKSYNDGTYSAQSENYVNDDEGDTAGNGYGVVELTIQNNAITACTFKTYELDGTLKDEEYGKEGGVIANKDFYNKAQKARAACDNYAEQLVRKGNLKEVDAISGATVNYHEFQEAVTSALKQAEQ